MLKRKNQSMNFIKSGTDSSGKKVELFYQDLGKGRPVVLIHGWPLSHAMWQYQLLELPKHGLRAIAYDRRGFGHSSKPWDGYDYDTFADDLKALLDALDLEDAILVGFSMGGGEIARYMAKYGGARVAKIAFVASVTPFMLKRADNPNGIDQSLFSQITAGLEKDYADFMGNFGKMFYGTGSEVSQAAMQWTQILALRASLKAAIDCVHAFGETDFRDDLKEIHVPSLVIHGESDQIVPIKLGGEQTAALLPKAKFLRYNGAPHGLFLPQKDRLNQDLLDFAR
jgi:pimeloyl-ACP methyl ester carboxylesterase